MPLEQHFEFDDIETHYADSIQNPALYLELAYPMLGYELPKILSRLLLKQFFELISLLRCHR
ncbi:MAG: hypothetical protein WBE74_21915, partial [Terracidiphilus sp.]